LKGRENWSFFCAADGSRGAKLLPGQADAAITRRRGAEGELGACTSPSREAASMLQRRGLRDALKAEGTPKGV